MSAAKSYHDELSMQLNQKMWDMCRNKYPDFVYGYMKYINDRTQPKTKLAYLSDIKVFLEYILEVRLVKKDG